jgi:hypothetical protein
MIFLEILTITFFLVSLVAYCAITIRSNEKAKHYNELAEKHIKALPDMDEHNL